MGRGWKNTNAKVRIRRKDLPEDVDRAYNKIKAYTEKRMRQEYSSEMFAYRVRYRYGFPKRIHYGRQVRALHRTMEKMIRYQISPEHALMQLEWIRNADRR